MFPFYLSWWRQHTSPRIAKLICFIYIMQVAQVVILCVHDKIGEEVHLTEIVVPLCLLIFLGILHSQIVCTYGTKKIVPIQLPNSNRIRHGTSGSTNCTVSSHRPSNRSGVSRSSKVKKSRLRSTSSRTKQVSTCSPSTLSPGESGQFDGETTGAEAEKLAEFISAKNKPVPDPVPWVAGSNLTSHNSADVDFSPESGTGQPRRRHRSWRLVSESPHRTVHPSNGTREKTTISSPNMARRGADSDESRVTLLTDKFLVRTVPSDEDQPKDPHRSEGDPEGVLLIGHSEDVGEEQLLMPDSIDGELMVVQPATASPVDSAFAESDVAKKSGSGTSSRPSSASSGPLSGSSSPGFKDEGGDIDKKGKEEAPIREVKQNDNGEEIVVKVTPVSEESDCPLIHRQNAENGAQKLRPLTLNRTERLRQVRSRSASPTPMPSTLLPTAVPCSCHESSNDDTYTSMSKRRVEFAQLFLMRSGRRPRRSVTTSVSGVCDGEDVDGFEHGLADESSDPEEEEKKVSAPLSEASQADNATAAAAGNGRYLVDPERSPTHKSQASETEYDRINSDVGSTDSTSESQNSDNGQNSANEMAAEVEDPFVLWFRESQPKQQVKAQRKETISCYVWEDEELKKSDLTLLDIGWSIIQAVERYPTECHYIRHAVIMSILLSFGPLLFRLYLRRDILWQLPHATLDIPVPQLVVVYIPSLFWRILFGRRWLSTTAVILGVVLRCCLYLMLFFLLCVAERTYAERLQYAKHFCYLTSSRRARKYYLPHFRLNKVSNIKSWLSLRSYLKKRGPQRSVDCIITSCIYIMLTVMSILCVHLLQDSFYQFLNHLINWDLLLVALALGLFLLRFMTLGAQITKKFRNVSVLITEQINLYLTMEKKPHKKDELMLAKNVLNLAEELLKELDGPFRICGWSMNPLVYNILKVVILSAFSAVLSEMLGFKLKLYKIKLNPINW